MAQRTAYTTTIRGLTLGVDAPVRVQAMTNTDTADINATVAQVVELHEAGAELVRLTVNNEAAARAVPDIRNHLERLGQNVPLVGDFHYNGHRLLADVPEMAEALDKYRINPGNVGFGQKQDRQFSQIIEQALLHQKPVRIGVNWGSLDQSVLARLMDENANRPTPWSAEEVSNQAIITSALESAERAEALGMRGEDIVLSCKVSNVRQLHYIYRALAAQAPYALHLGLTEAGMGIKGIVASVAALAPLLLEGIGQTIRISLTPKPGGSRSDEVRVAQELLQSLNLRAFAPQVTACPGCGRTTSTYFQELAERIETHLHARMREWKRQYPGVERLNVAVMGCIVNGPGESRHADIGISLPGTGESPVAPVFEDGEKTLTLRGEHIAEEFIALVDAYVIRRYGV